jgi:hypothetical protein
LLRDSEWYVRAAAAGALKAWMQSGLRFFPGFQIRTIDELVQGKPWIQQNQ